MPMAYGTYANRPKSSSGGGLTKHGWMANRGCNAHLSVLGPYLDNLAQQPMSKEVLRRGWLPPTMRRPSSASTPAALVPEHFAPIRAFVAARPLAPPPGYALGGAIVVRQHRQCRLAVRQSGLARKWKPRIADDGRRTALAAGPRRPPGLAASALQSARARFMARVTTSHRLPDTCSRFGAPTKPTRAQTRRPPHNVGDPHPRDAVESGEAPWRSAGRESGPWLHVQVEPEGPTVWARPVSQPTILSPLHPGVARASTIRGGYLALRNGPSSTHGQIGQAPHGSVLSRWNPTPKRSARWGKRATGCSGHPTGWAMAAVSAPLRANHRRGSLRARQKPAGACSAPPRPPSRPGCGCRHRARIAGAPDVTADKLEQFGARLRCARPRAGGVCAGRGCGARSAGYPQPTRRQTPLRPLRRFSGCTRRYRRRPRTTTAHPTAFEVAAADVPATTKKR